MLHTQKPFEVYLFWDGAVDLAASNIDQYLEERDVKHLVHREGALPMVFICRPLDTLMATKHVLPQLHIATQRELIFRASVIEVRNCDRRLEDKAPRPGGFIPSRAGQEDWKRLADKPWILRDDEMRLFDSATRQEVGEVCLGRAFLPRGIDGGYQVPGTSQRVLQAMSDLVAAQAQGTSGDKATTTGSSRRPSEPKSGAVGGDAGGAVTVTAKKRSGSRRTRKSKRT